MMDPRMGRHAELSFAPRLMGATEAASYLGISETTLRGLGIPRRILGGRKLYDRLDLDAYASELPTESESEEVNTCQGKSGRTR